MKRIGKEEEYIKMRKRKDLERDEEGNGEV